MKIRWTNGSIRFRISPQELEALLHGRRVEAHLALPNGGLRARIAVAGSGDDGGAYGIAADAGAVEVRIGARDAARLAEQSAEGIYFTSNGPEPVRYYIEKDFPCLHTGAPEAGETRSETFDPPPGFDARHGNR